MGLQPAAIFVIYVCTIRNYTLMSAVRYRAILFFLCAAREPTHSKGCGCLPQKVWTAKL